MATVTLTATNYSTTNVATVTNASNAYTDTTSSTYAQVTTTSSSSSKAYFYGFDFSQIPNGATITSVTYKIKVKTVGSGGSTFYVFLENRNTSSELSAKTSTASTTSETVVTLTPTSATWSDIVAMGDNFAFCVQHSRTTRTQNVYGMEIDVTYTIPYVPNKVVYGGNTLIDLTADTVTAADVASGKTFHLANGTQGIGTASGGVTQGKISSQTSVSSSSLSFAGLQGEPISFVVYINAIQGASWINYSGSAEYRTLFIYYDGTDRYTIAAYTDAMNPAIVRTNGSDISFTYTNGTLSFSSSSAYGGKFYTALTFAQYTLVYWY